MRLRSLFLRITDRLLTDSQREKELAFLTTQAEFALRAGVRPTLEEWAGLAPIEQGAWVRAGDAVACASAARAGFANSSKAAAAAVASVADGGKVEKELTEAKRDETLQRGAVDIMKRYGGWG